MKNYNLVVLQHQLVTVDNMETLNTLIVSRMFELITYTNVGVLKDYNTLKEAIDYVNSETYYDKFTEFFINCLK